MKDRTHDGAPSLEMDFAPKPVREIRSERDANVEGFTSRPPEPLPVYQPLVTLRFVKVVVFIVTFITTCMWLYP